MNDFINKLIESELMFLGVPKGITIFKGYDNNYYYQRDKFEAEIRIFKNITHNYFEKDILWERFQSNINHTRMTSDEPLYIEFKNLNESEFSHWGNDSIGMSYRKRLEFSNFNLLAELTKNGRKITTEDMDKYDFEQFLDEFPF